MNFEELKKLGAAALADIICSEISVLDSKIKELQEKIKEYEGLDDTDSSYMEMAYGFKLNECEGAKDRLLMLARIERDRQGKYVELSGKLSTIDADGDNFSLEGITFLSKVHCNIMNDKQKRILIGKNRGDIVVVKGRIKRVGELTGYSIDIGEMK